MRFDRVESQSTWQERLAAEHRNTTPTIEPAGAIAPDRKDENRPVCFGLWPRAREIYFGAED